MRWLLPVSEEECRRARLTRDPRYDGRFFIGVRTTGVYCRSVCPARQPLEKNVCYFASAAAAERHGFRPCLRCRPETAPGSPAWRGSAAVVSRALRLIEEGALDQASVEDLAERLGLGERHLRRLFMRYTGATPLDHAATRRLHRAIRLLRDSETPVTAIALEAGYRSIRSFNRAFRQAFQRSPSSLRRT
jgi:methylphosphotriester-DNA--protein-cysteine methyltransferase